MSHASPPRRELLHAKLDALLDESDLVVDCAAYGETFDTLEDFFFTKGPLSIPNTGNNDGKTTTKRGCTRHGLPPNRVYPLYFIFGTMHGCEEYEGYLHHFF